MSKEFEHYHELEKIRQAQAPHKKAEHEERLRIALDKQPNKQKKSQPGA